MLLIDVFVEIPVFLYLFSGKLMMFNSTSQAYLLSVKFKLNTKFILWTRKALELDKFLPPTGLDLL